MEMMVINGSPRKHGNSAHLAETFIQGTGHSHHVTEVFLQDMDLHCCRSCYWCKSHYRCLLDDAMNDLAIQFKKSEVICLVTPVYWWGISAQLKIFIDRLYQLQTKDYAKKQLYVIACGSDSLEGVQYRLIKEQFAAICEYTGMQFAGYLPVSADDDNPVAEDENTLQKARTLFIKG